MAVARVWRQPSTRMCSTEGNPRGRAAGRRHEGVGPVWLRRDGGRACTAGPGSCSQHACSKQASGRRRAIPGLVRQSSLLWYRQNSLLASPQPLYPTPPHPPPPAHLNAFMEGYPRMPFCWHSACCCSQFTAPTLTTPCSASASLRHLGASWRQWPLQLGEGRGRGLDTAVKPWQMLLRAPPMRLGRRQGPLHSARVSGKTAGARGSPASPPGSVKLNQPNPAVAVALGEGVIRQVLQGARCHSVFY